MGKANFSTHWNGRYIWSCPLLVGRRSPLPPTQTPWKIHFRSALSFAMYFSQCKGGPEEGRFGLLQHTYGNFSSPYEKCPHFILFKVEGGGYQPPSYALILSLVETWLMWPWIFDTKGKSTMCAVTLTCEDHATSPCLPLQNLAKPVVEDWCQFWSLSFVKTLKLDFGHNFAVVFCSC